MYYFADHYNYILNVYKTYYLYLYSKCPLIQLDSLSIHALNEDQLQML